MFFTGGSMISNSFSTFFMLVLSTTCPPAFPLQISAIVSKHFALIYNSAYNRPSPQCSSFA